MQIKPPWNKIVFTSLVVHIYSKHDYDKVGNTMTIAHTLMLPTQTNPFVAHRIVFSTRQR